MKKNISNKKKIIFVSATRADYGKLKSLMGAIKESSKFDYKIFITGMHNLKKYGNTYQEILKDKFKKFSRFNNQKINDPMDIVLSNTIRGFHNYVLKTKPDLVIIHGDRVEPLACAIVCSLNNILIGHIEGGEISGTVDEMLRHSISKLSHFHFVSNKDAKKRLLQMGELQKNIFVIGSPDLDIIKSNFLPDIDEVKKRYDIKFSNYGILLHHPVTTDIKNIELQSKNICKAILKSKKNFIIIYPNNDLGSNIILKNYLKYLKGEKFKILPSLRFEYFVTLMKNSSLIIGNSSAGVREAPVLGVNSINLGSRQHKRSKFKNIINLEFNQNLITKNIISSFKRKNFLQSFCEFGHGDTAKRFVQIISKPNFFNLKTQKHFKDLNINFTLYRH